MIPQRIVTGLGILLLVLAGIFYFVHVAEAAVMPLFIIGTIVAVIGLATGR